MARVAALVAAGELNDKLARQVIEGVLAGEGAPDEVVATVAYLVNSGRVRLCGTFAGAKIALRPSLPSFLMRVDVSSYGEATLN